MCKAVGIHRSSYKYWKKYSRVIKPKRIKELAMVKMIHSESNGSAGVRAIAMIATNIGLDLSRYRARGLMLEQSLESCQQLKHAYKKVLQPHILSPIF